MKKILIADDDVISRELIAEYIEDMGYVAIRSSNGRHAYEILLDNHDIDLLICDMMMPEMSGSELVMTIRGIGYFTGLPILVISGVIGSEMAGVIKELGASCYLSKPLDKSVLEGNIASLLN